jgi:hypothetical protein
MFSALTGCGVAGWSHNCSKRDTGHEFRSPSATNVYTAIVSFACQSGKHAVEGGPALLLSSHSDQR